MPIVAGPSKFVTLSDIYAIPSADGLTLTFKCLTDQAVALRYRVWDVTNPAASAQGTEPGPLTVHNFPYALAPLTSTPLGRTVGFEITSTTTPPPTLRPYRGTVRMPAARAKLPTEFHGFTVTPPVLNYSWAQYNPNGTSTAIQTPSMMTAAIPTSLRDFRVEPFDESPNNVYFKFTTDRPLTSYQIKILPEPCEMNMEGDSPFGSGAAYIYDQSLEVGSSTDHIVQGVLASATAGRAFKIEVTGIDDLGRPLRLYTDVWRVAPNAYLAQAGRQTWWGWNNYKWINHVKPVSMFPTMITGSAGWFTDLASPGTLVIARTTVTIPVTGGDSLPPNSMVRVLWGNYRDDGFDSRIQTYEFATARALMSDNDVRNFKLTDLKPNTKYRYTVEIRTPDGQEWFNNRDNFTTSP